MPKTFENVWPSTKMIRVIILILLFLIVPNNVIHLISGFRHTLSNCHGIYLPYHLNDGQNSQWMHSEAAVLTGHWTSFLSNFYLSKNLQECSVFSSGRSVHPSAGFLKLIFLCCLLETRTTIIFERILLHGVILSETEIIMICC